MPKFISVKKAAAIARGLKPAYDGPDEYEPLMKWLADNPTEFVDKDGQPLIVTKAVVVNPEPGEDDDAADDDEPVTIDADELKRLRKAAGEAAVLKSDAMKGVAKVHASASSPGRTPRDMARAAEHKAYNRKAAAGKTVFGDADEAELWNAWFRHEVMGRSWDYSCKQRDRDIIQKANITTDFNSGGALIPEVLIPSLIDIRLKHGVARRLAGFQPMPNDTAQLIRMAGDLTVYTPNAEVTEVPKSNTKFNRAELVARKRMTSTDISNEMMNDAVLSIGDITAKNIMWSFEKDIDNRWINGDGTSNYANDVGLREALKSLSSTISDIAGLHVGSGNEYSELTLADFVAVVSLLPDLESVSGEPVWLVNKNFYDGTMARVALAAGGVNATEIVGGTVRRTFLGYNVEFSNAMPRVQANSQVCALFGWFDMGSRIGEVTNSMRIKVDESVAVREDATAVIGRVRNAVLVHDVGNASATDALRQPGPIVGLITAAS